jgi:hypothetical protein
MADESVQTPPVAKSARTSKNWRWMPMEIEMGAGRTKTVLDRIMLGNRGDNRNCVLLVLRIRFLHPSSSSWKSCAASPCHPKNRTFSGSGGSAFRMSDGSPRDAQWQRSDRTTEYAPFWKLRNHIERYWDNDAFSLTVLLVANPTSTGIRADHFRTMTKWSKSVVWSWSATNQLNNQMKSLPQRLINLTDFHVIILFQLSTKKVQSWCGDDASIMRVNQAEQFNSIQALTTWKWISLDLLQFRSCFKCKWCEWVARRKAWFT